MGSDFSQRVIPSSSLALPALFLLCAPMGAGVASTPLRLSHSVVLRAPSASRTPASATFTSSPSSRRLSILSTTSLTQLLLSSSCVFPKRKPRSVRCLCRRSFNSFSGEESSNQADDLTRRLSNDFASISGDDFCLVGEGTYSLEWEDGADFLASIEQKASCTDLPLSVRMLKMKLQLQEGFREAGESAYCSIKAAFSSMLFIIREIQSYTLQMRQIPLYEDLQSLLVRVQEDIHASFVWLFQRVFSQTPNLMVYLMILLANYSVQSIGSTPAIAAPWPPVEAVTMVEIQEKEYNQYVSPPRKTSLFSSLASGGKSTSVDGGNGDGGGNSLPGLSGTDGEGRFGQSSHLEAMFTDASSMSSSLGPMREEEADIWKAIVKEASEMQAAIRDESLDRETVENLVSPVTAKAEADDGYSEYLRTEVLYQIGLSHDPNNQLLLTNFAQFLYLVAHDYDRYQFMSAHLILLLYNLKPSICSIHLEMMDSFILWQQRQEILGQNFVIWVNNKWLLERFAE